jgi:hypothetical protein
MFVIYNNKCNQIHVNIYKSIGKECSQVHQQSPHFKRNSHPQPLLPHITEYTQNLDGHSAVHWELSVEVL